MAVFLDAVPLALANPPSRIQTLAKAPRPFCRGGRRQKRKPEAVDKETTSIGYAWPGTWIDIPHIGAHGEGSGIVLMRPSEGDRPTWRL
ncbi:MAG: hypothetical protein ACK4ZW_00380 [Blastomonas sp.]